MKTYLMVYFGTFLVAVILVPIISRLAKRCNLVDVPGPRKVHKSAIPRIGGIAFVLATLALVVPTFLLSNDIGQSFRDSRTEFIALFLGACFVFAVGLIDDLRPVRGYVKLLCLIGASLGVCASGAIVRDIAVGTWFTLETGWAAWPFSVCWIVMITVCMNLIDGLDGLAAGIAAIVCGTLVLLAFLTGQVAMVVLMLALLGSVCGFLFFNFYPAKIFMGDCGSMFLGFMIGAGSLVCQTKTGTMVGLAIPFLVMGVPIFDTSIVLIGRRILERRSMFAPDRGHLHHRLLDLGLRHRTVVIVIYAVTAISASVGVLMLSVEPKPSIGLLGVGVALLFSVFACFHGGRLSKIMKGLRRNWAIAHKAKEERHSFEDAQLRMRESRSFDTWWQTVCDMGKQMQFESIGLWSRENGRYVSACQWNAPDGKFPPSRSVKVNFPFHSDRANKWEIRASIWADGYLEVSGRQAMLLSRLIDEFPLPEDNEEAKSLGK
ncbi:MAG: glycosyltransferase family 4 protein [Planctomycetota bacterium]|jgi:UDP-GlcNAc:undecaprenyl-phosphate GlcNAc-1-phosphate transferase